jgi:hypothetical protein
MATAMLHYDTWALEIFKAVLVVLGTVLIGQRMVAQWQMRNKRKELEIASAAVFQQMYGEFKDIWRVWKIVRNPSQYAMSPPADARFDLLKRATAAEAKVEALVVKLAVERTLKPEEIEKIALFRQGYQRLRQRIRDNKEMEYNYKDPEYRLFNDLATRFAGILLSEPPRDQPEHEVAARQLETIAKYRRKDWKAAKAKYRPYDKVDTEDVVDD